MAPHCNWILWEPMLLCWVSLWRVNLIARFMGPTWGPHGADRTQVGPILVPWTLLSGQVSILHGESVMLSQDVCFVFVLDHIIWTLKHHKSKEARLFVKQLVWGHLQGHILWVLQHLKSPDCWLSVQQFVQVNYKENIKTLQYCPFVRGIHQWPVEIQ